MTAELQKCLICGVHEPINTMTKGICEYCVEEIKLKKSSRYLVEQHNKAKNENPYLLLGFLEFAILSTLMFVFFPWSLLFCLIFYGMEQTKLIVIALLHDFAKTAWAIFLVALFLIVIIVIIFIFVYFVK